MLFNQKIDIIIPIYNTTYEQMFNCLSSIATQSLKNEIKITIVDDASLTKDYLRAIVSFEEYLDIDILFLENNGGPGVARQYGIDNTYNEYIVFIDADDMLSNGFALQHLKEGITSNPLYSVCIGSFNEIQYTKDDKLLTIPHEENFVWMHAKIYKREFLLRHNIRFHPTSRANEDAGFNMMCKLYSSDAELIASIKNTVYNWCFNKNSIVRKNNCEYATSGNEDASFYGYVENMIYALNTLLNDDTIKDKQQIYHQVVECMFQIYISYLILIDKASEEDAYKYIEASKMYYTEVYSRLTEENVSKEEFEKIYSEVFEAKYVFGQLRNIMPKITFYNFIEMLTQ